MEGRAGAGALGPRLAGRLTAELILRSPQYMSCVKDYEIDLRGDSTVKAACDSLMPYDVERSEVLLNACHASQVTSFLQ